MNGATAVPCVKTIKAPNINKNSMIGSNQYFFLAIKKVKNSIKNFILKLIFKIIFKIIFFIPICIFIV